MALVQSKQGNAGGYTNNFTVTPNSSVTAGSLLILVITAGSADVINSLSDGVNTWTLAKSEIGPARQTWVYCAQNASAGTPNIAVTFAGYPDSLYFFREYSVIVTTSALDQTVSTPSSGYVNSHPSGTTAATTQADELVIATVGSDGSSAPGFTISGYSNLQTQQGFDLYTYGAIADNIVSSTGTQSATFSSGSNHVQSQTVLVTFKVASAGATGQIKVWNGTAFVAKPVKVWNGTSWAVKPVKCWNGTTWVTTPY